MKTLSEIEAAADAYVATLKVSFTEMWEAIRRAFIDGVIAGKIDNKNNNLNG